MASLVATMFNVARHHYQILYVELESWVCSFIWYSSDFDRTKFAGDVSNYTTVKSWPPLLNVCLHRTCPPCEGHLFKKHVQSMLVHKALTQTQTKCTLHVEWTAVHVEWSSIYPLWIQLGLSQSSVLCWCTAAHTKDRCILGNMSVHEQPTLHRLYIIICITDRNS